MIPRVEELRAELRIPPFIDARALQDADVRVADGRPAANRSRRITESSEIWVGKIIRVKEVICGHVVDCLDPAPIELLERGSDIRLPDRQEEEATHQLLVVTIGNENGKARLIGNDRGSAPTVKDFAAEAIVLGDREYPIRAEDEPMGGVEQRERPAQAWINWIEQFLEA